MKKFLAKLFEKRKRRKKFQPEPRSKNIHRSWGLATRLKRPKTKEKRK